KTKHSPYYPIALMTVPSTCLPGATLPSSQLYNLSKAEQTTMEDYIRDSLNAVLCRIPTSLFPDLKGEIP
ncbi:unnamed protein product, partial [Lampetra planeri]